MTVTNYQLLSCRNVFISLECYKRPFYGCFCPLQMKALQPPCLVWSPSSAGRLWCACSSWRRWWAATRTALTTSTTTTTRLCLSVKSSREPKSSSVRKCPMTCWGATVSTLLPFCATGRGCPSRFVSLFILFHQAQISTLSSKFHKEWEVNRIILYERHIM